MASVSGTTCGINKRMVGWGGEKRDVHTSAAPTERAIHGVRVVAWSLIDPASIAPASCRSPTPIADRHSGARAPSMPRQRKMPAETADIAPALGP